MRAALNARGPLSYVQSSTVVYGAIVYFQCIEETLSANMMQSEAQADIQHGFTV